MNKKGTNRLVAILNVISIISTYVLGFSTEYILSGIMWGAEIDGLKSIYNSFFIEFLLNNIQIIMTLVNAGVGILNIICAIQNRKNKKIFFWQLVFGIYEIFSAMATSVFLDNSDIIEWSSKIIGGIIPIILAIVNLVLIKKNKPKVIQVISYIIVIIISILALLDILGAYWNVIAIIMQFIYIHKQEKDIEESTARKIVNIILYYILQIILVLGFFAIIVISLITTKVNDVKLESQLSELFNRITTMQGVRNKELLIPVENDYKYGFVNENGEEVIPCEYDNVSYFNEVEINNFIYYIALAKKDNEFYIMSKANDSIIIEKYLKECLQMLDDNLVDSITEGLNAEGDYRNGYLQAFEFVFQALSARGGMEVSAQMLETNSLSNNVNLMVEDYTYYYESNNYFMEIEPIYIDDYNEESYYDEYENTYYLSSNDTKYNVTVTKANGEQESSIVYLPGIDEYDFILDTFSNGYIEFVNEEQTKRGWYDSNGNQITIPSDFQILDIKDDKIILQLDSIQDESGIYRLNYAIIDLEGRTLLQTSAINIYENIYLVKDDDNKMVLMDNELNIISNEYDKIITNAQIDISRDYSSYY